MENRVLANLEPKKVFAFFEELCQLPHESHKTVAASDWAEKFAKDRGLTYRRDKVGNVVIWKEATPGYEDHPTVMIQGHLDMVCVKDNGVAHDFEKDPLKLFIEDGFVKAHGTSLGGDDGIAIAMAMTILDDDTNIPHPPLECVFTVDEEVGMLGAGALDCFDLKAKYLLNIDSELEGVLTVGCAGGTRCEINLPLHSDPSEGTLVTLNLEHLAGGHSGTAINMGLGNADKIMAEGLVELGYPRLVSLDGGQQDNAIPNQCKAVVLVDNDKAEAFVSAAKAWGEKLKAQWVNDPNMTLTITTAPGAVEALSDAATKEALDLVCALPNGVQAMNPDLPGQVQTSLNLGIMHLENSKLELVFLVRSSALAEQCALTEKLLRIAIEFGAFFSTTSSYLPWEYRRESKLRDTMVQVFTEQYGKAPIVETVHAGLECGLLMKKMPGLDAVSFGPDLLEIHSTRERMGIASTERVWKFLLGVLKAL